MKTIVNTIEALGACKLIGTHPAGSPEWLALRATSLGGSDIAPIMNASPFKSAYTLWAEKLSLVPPVETTIQMRMGQLFESAIVQLFRETNPALVVHDTSWTFESLANPAFHANPDGIIEDQDGELYILEIKHTRNYWDELPEYYRLQVVWYQYVTGLHNPAIVCAVTGGDYRQFQVDYDPETLERVLEASTGFLELLKTKTPPEWDGSLSTYETVRELSPGLKDETVELGKSYVDLIAAKEIYDLAEKNLNKYKTITLAEMDGAKIGTFLGDHVITLQARNNKPFITFKKGY